MRLVRDDPLAPDPGFAELFCSLPDATDLEPWLGWCRAASGPVLYLGVGAGRLAVPLAREGVTLTGVDAHPLMLAHLRSRLGGAELVLARVEELELSRRFPLVIAPSNLLHTAERLRTAARHAAGHVGLELMNPHWLAAGAGRGVRVRELGPERAGLEIEYPGGFVQEAQMTLVWPERTEAWLGTAGLELERLSGTDPVCGLEASPGFYVYARRRLRR